MSIWTPCPTCGEPLAATDHDHGCPNARRVSAMKHPGGFRFTPEELQRRLGIRGQLYKIDFAVDGNRDVIFWCWGAQDEYTVKEGEVAPVVKADPR